jgi:hypothetical protein
MLPLYSLLLHPSILYISPSSQQTRGGTHPSTLSLSFYLPPPSVSLIPLSLSMLAPLPLLLRRRAAAGPTLSQLSPRRAPPRSRAQAKAARRAAHEAHAGRCSVHRSGGHPCSSWCWRATRCEVAGVEVASPARDPPPLSPLLTRLPLCLLCLARPRIRSADARLGGGDARRRRTPRGRGRALGVEIAVARAEGSEASR